MTLPSTTSRGLFAKARIRRSSRVSRSSGAGRVTGFGSMVGSAYARGVPATHNHGTDDRPNLSRTIACEPDVAESINGLRSRDVAGRRRAIERISDAGRTGIRSDAHISDATSLVPRLLHVDELDVEHKRGVRRDHRREPAFPVSEMWWNGELTLAADLHPHNALVPSLDDHPFA